MQKENSFFFCIPEREYLRCKASKLRLSERNAKEKLGFLLYSRTWVTKMQSIKVSANRAKYKRKTRFSFVFPSVSNLEAQASKVRLSERKTKENTFSFDFPNVSNYLPTQPWKVTQIFYNSEDRVNTQSTTGWKPNGFHSPGHRPADIMYIPSHVL